MRAIANASGQAMSSGDELLDHLDAVTFDEHRDERHHPGAPGQGAPEALTGPLRRRIDGAAPGPIRCINPTRAQQPQRSEASAD
jgi:hypothetical protein